MSLWHAVRGTGAYATVKQPLAWRLSVEWSFIEQRLKSFGGWPQRWWSWVFDAEEWVYEEHRYFFPAAGYVSARVSNDCISKALNEWRRHCSEQAAPGGAR